MRGNDLGGCGLKLGQGGQEAATSSSQYVYSEESGEGEDEFGNVQTYYWEEFNAVASC